MPDITTKCISVFCAEGVLIFCSASECGNHFSIACSLWGSLVYANTDFFCFHFL